MLNTTSTDPVFSHVEYGRLLASALPVVIETEEDRARIVTEIRRLSHKGDADLAPEELQLLKLLTKLVTGTRIMPSPLSARMWMLWK